MAGKLNFRATTASGKVFEFTFPLHPDTTSAPQVGGLLSELVDTVDRFVRTNGDVGNGDVLQAMAMALAVRAGMLGPHNELVSRLAAELVAAALDADCRAADGSRTH